MLPAPLIIFATFVGYVAGGFGGAMAMTADVAVLGLVVAYRWKSGWAVPVLIGLSGLIGAAMLRR